MLRTLLPILLVLAACSKSEGKTGDGSSGNSAVTVKQIEKADLNGCADMLRNMLRDTNSVLDGVTDVASARKAKSKISALADQSEPLRRRMDELTGAQGTAEDKMAFGVAMMEMMGETSQLSSQFERLEGMPGVRGGTRRTHATAVRVLRSQIVPAEGE